MITRKICTAPPKEEMMSDTAAAAPTEPPKSVEQRIIKFLTDREDEHRRNLVGQTGEARERLVSAMLENYWLRRAVESGELMGNGQG